jgi:hypothetical protein
MRVRISPAEADLLRQLDRAYRQQLLEKAEAGLPKPKTLAQQLEDIALANEAQKLLEAQRAKEKQQRG